MAFTFFFRDADALDLAIAEALPDLRGRAFIHIWDAGCAHGPEPYTLAILLRERMSEFIFRNVRIHATDVDATFAAQVRTGVFPAGEIQRVPPGIAQRYFRPAAPGFVQVVPELRAKIEFSVHDLLCGRPIREGLSMVVCKNVLLHLEEPLRLEVLQMFHAAMQPGGVLVMEHTQKLPAGLQPFFRQVAPQAQVYRKMDPVFAGHAAEPVMSPHVEEAALECGDLSPLSVGTLSVEKRRDHAAHGTAPHSKAAMNRRTPKSTGETPVAPNPPRLFSKRNRRPTFMATVAEPAHALETKLSETHGTIQLVSFELANELYGIEITKVREIILIAEITQVPRTPHYVKGLINLRSSVIPVIDLRALFGLPEGARTDESRIMVLQAGGKTIGIMVDAVSEVLRVKKDAISPPPPTVAQAGNEYLIGLVKLDKQLLILLDIDRVLGAEGAETLGA